MALSARPIATISYNTYDFLVERLEALVKSHKISEYRFIHHVGEGGDKDHYHVQMFPTSTRLDLVSLREWFIEPDPSGNPKPLGVLQIRKSAELDWLLYAVHDPIYLEAHSDIDDLGKIEYSIDEVIGNIPEQIQRDYRSALANNRRGIKAEIVHQIMLGRQAGELMVRFPDQVAYILQAYRLGQLRGMSLSGADVDYYKSTQLDDSHPLSDKLLEDTFGGDK